MSLSENPSNANVWLSDPDTHPLVSQLLRVYHAEKYSKVPMNKKSPAAIAKMMQQKHNHSPKSFASSSSNLFTSNTQMLRFNSTPLLYNHPHTKSILGQHTNALNTPSDLSCRNSCGVFGQVPDYLHANNWSSSRSNLIFQYDNNMEMDFNGS